ncbi:hypothetical protein, partial [Helicobacter heilmannii]|uniref:hypothetical protein n=1 Tax=Helicobacter heilmannii TaxID=35817 RepID=UPI001F460032
PKWGKAIHVLMLVYWDYYSDKTADRYIDMRDKEHELSNMWQRALSLKRNCKVKDYATGKPIEVNLKGQIVDMRCVFDGRKFANTDDRLRYSALYAPIYEVNKGITAPPEHTERREKREKEALTNALEYPTLVASPEQIRKMPDVFFLQFNEQIKGLKLWGAGGVFANIKGDKPKVIDDPVSLEAHKPNNARMDTYESVEEISAKKSVACFTDCIGRCDNYAAGEEYPILARIHKKELDKRIQERLVSEVCKPAFAAIRNEGRVLPQVQDPIERRHKIILAMLHEWHADNRKNAEVVDSGWVGAQLRKAFVYDRINERYAFTEGVSSMYSYLNARIEDIEAELTGVSKEKLKKMSADKRSLLRYEVLRE